MQTVKVEKVTAVGGKTMDKYDFKTKNTSPVTVKQGDYIVYFDGRGMRHGNGWIQVTLEELRTHYRPKNVPSGEDGIYHTR